MRQIEKREQKVAMESAISASRQRVVEHQAVGTVHALQLLELKPLLFTTNTGGEQQGDKKDEAAAH
jgi:hypothetical protein